MSQFHSSAPTVFFVFVTTFESFLFLMTKKSSFFSFFADNYACIDMKNQVEIFMRNHQES